MSSEPTETGTAKAARREAMSDQRLERLAVLAELPCSCDSTDCQNFASALTGIEARELVTEVKRQRDEIRTLLAEHEQLAAAAVRGEAAEELRKAAVKRMQRLEAGLATEKRFADNDRAKVAAATVCAEQDVRAVAEACADFDNADGPRGIRRLYGRFADRIAELEQRDAVHRARTNGA